MAVIINKDEDKNVELTERITADLRSKMLESSKNSGNDPDFAEDSEYVKDFKKTEKFAWVWVVFVVALIAVAVIVGLNH